MLLLVLLRWASFFVVYETDSVEVDLLFLERVIFSSQEPLVYFVVVWVAAVAEAVEEVNDFAESVVTFAGVAAFGEVSEQFENEVVAAVVETL